jgi:Leu/Phe-tRNA-protein transferase
MAPNGTQEERIGSRPRRERQIQDYIPNYLRNVITPYQSDFCFTPIHHPQLITQLMAEGFLPIATEGYLLPKLHRRRCVVKLPEALHVSKSTRKKSRRYSMTANQAFDQVVEGCREQHGMNWLFPPLVEAFKQMHTNDNNAATLPNHKSCSVKLYSIEVWDQQGQQQLVAGELGYTVNSIYTSLTGFSHRDSAGSVQLVALGKWLCSNGYTMWDLGMDMEYKRSLGAILMPRDDFVAYLHAVRIQEGDWKLPAGPVNCRDIIDGTVTMDE